MSSLARVLVWLSVVAASIGVGVYVSQAPPSDPQQAAPTTPGRYLFLAGGADPYWELCIAGARSAAADIDAELEVLKPTDEGETGLLEQLEWLGTIDGEAWDGLAIGPIDPTRETTLINAAADKLTTVTIDSDAPQSRRVCYIGSSNYEAGMLAAQMLKEAAPEGGKVALLVASLAKTNAAARVEGFRDELSGVDDDAIDGEEPDGEDATPAEYNLLDLVFDQGDPAACEANVAKLLAEHDDLVAIVGTFGYHGPIALEAVGKLSAGRAVRVIAFDEDERTLAGVAEGRAHATIVQDPFMFGAEAIRMLEQVRQGKFLEMPIARQVDVGVHCVVVKQDNLEAFRKNLADRLASAEPAQ
ncbi:MAG: substrate-binding domain-containing protein [Planctomycetota bacterium]